MQGARHRGLHEGAHPFCVCLSLLWKRSAPRDLFNKRIYHLVGDVNIAAKPQQRASERLFSPRGGDVPGCSKAALVASASPC